MGIGKNVKKYRTALGMDQKTLAAMLGVTAGAVSNYENNVSSPKEEVLYKMFEVFNVTPDELFAGCYSETKKSPAPEGTEETLSAEDMKLSADLRALLAKHGLLNADGDITAEQADIILYTICLLRAALKESGEK